MGACGGKWQPWSRDASSDYGLRLDLRGRPFDPSGPRPTYFTDSLWGFLLEEKPGGRTRLVVSGYWCLKPRWLQPIMSVLFLEVEHWIMQMRQFTNLKRRVEGTPVPTTETATGEELLVAGATLASPATEPIDDLAAESASTP